MAHMALLTPGKRKPRTSTTQLRTSGLQNQPPRDTDDIIGRQVGRAQVILQVDLHGEAVGSLSGWSSRVAVGLVGDAFEEMHSCDFDDVEHGGAAVVQVVPEVNLEEDRVGRCRGVAGHVALGV